MKPTFYSDGCQDSARTSAHDLKRGFAVLSVALVLLIASGIPALAQELFRGTTQGKTIVVNRADQGVTVTFPSEAHLSSFSLENPPRVVIDATGLKLPPTWSTAKGVSDPLVRKIRMASHPGKVRVVLDLTVNANRVSHAASENQAVISLNEDSKKKAPVSKTAVIAATPTKEPKKATPTPSNTHTSVPTAKPTQHLSTPTPPSTPTSIPEEAAEILPTEPPTPAFVEPTEAPLIPTIAPTSTPTEVPTPKPPTATPTTHPTPPPPSVPTAKPTQPPILKDKAPNTKPTAEISEPSLPIAPSEDGRLLSAIDFDSVDGENVVAFRLTNRPPPFQLSRRDDRTFLLTIPHTGIATLGLALPQYPPQQFKGIAFVHAQGGEPQLMVTIGVEKGIKLTAVPNGDVVFVKVDAPIE